MKTGLILDSPYELSKLPQADLLLGAASDAPAPNWRDLKPVFRSQGLTRYCTAYAGTSIGSMFQKLEHGDDREFSPGELFFRSNGSMSGNSLMNVAFAMRDSLVLEKDVPTIFPKSWTAHEFARVKATALASKDALDRGKVFRMKDLAVVSTSKALLKRYLLESPIYIAIGIGKGYWLDPAPRPRAYNDFHAVVLLGYDEDDCPIIFDSIAGYPNFDGVHRLAPDYDIFYGMMFTDLPVDWETIQNTLREKNFNLALAHYGKNRDLLQEMHTARWMAEALKRHPTLGVYFGKEWTVAVNAYVYGEYSFQDLLNHYTSIRRGQGEIFNLNELRKQG